MTPIARVLRYCEAWGVVVVEGRPHDDEHAHGVTDGPRGGWLDYRRAIIYWPHGDEPNALLHELSHALASESPTTIDEIGSEMLAFEHASTRRLRIGGWREWMCDYVVAEWSRRSASCRLTVTSRVGRAPGPICRPESAAGSCGSRTRGRSRGGCSRRRGGLR